MHQLHLKVPYLLRKDINELYITNALRTFAISTISIFIPIFLLQKGYSLLHVGLYLLFKTCIASFLCYNALKFASRKGVKHTIYASVPLMILFFLALYNLDQVMHLFGYMVILLVLAFLESVAGAYYYMGFHIEFAKFSAKKKSVKQLGIINILSTVFTIIGPLFGAMVISAFSFNTLFVIVMVLLFLSIIPLMFSREFHEPFEFDLKKLISSHQTYRIWPYISEGFRDTAGRVLWPVFFYLIFVSLKAIGGVYAVSNTLLVLFTLYLGSRTSKSNKFKILKWGTYIHSLTLVMRVFVKTISMLTIVQGFGGLSWTMVNLPFQSTFYNNSKKMGITYGIFFRELYLHLGRVLSTLLFVIFVLLMKAETALIASIITGAVGMLLMSSIKDE